MPSPSAVVDELATVLFALDTGRRSTAGVTSQITAEIVRWAVTRGWSARTEARVHAPDADHGDQRLGFLDVIVRRGNLLPDLAIEIDSTDKPWSVTKLRHAAQAGMVAIWVRWGDDDWAGIFDEIDVIQLPLIRRTGHRGTSNQPCFWP
ncbi:MAG TPA: hypothetical protein VMZ33_00030 [Candidatus Limnocylindrales bacterium]|nr:hypothetical protein [Candidatus Limnocylindrales bacterium]